MRGVVKVGRFQAFMDRRQVYLDHMPRGAYGWRLMASWGPLWLTFSQRYGYKPAPRIWRIGPLRIGYLRSETETP